MTLAPPTSPAAAFRLPGLSLPFPVPSQRADAAVLRAEACRWALQHGLISERGHNRLLTNRVLDLGLGLAGEAERERAAVVMGWFLWMLVLDDRIDDGPWASDGVLEAFAESALSIVDGPCAASVPAADPMLRILAEDLWPRTRALARPEQTRRLRKHFIAHLQAQSGLLEGAPDLADYAGMRRDLFGADLFFDLIEVAHGYQSGGAPHLRDSAADVIAWTNDLYSLEKDLAMGEAANLAIIMRRDRALSWQQAVDEVHGMITARTQDFLAARAACSTPSDLAFADRLAQVMRASLDWHQSMPRYHRQTTPGPRVDLHDTIPSLLWPQFAHHPHPLYATLRERFPLVYDDASDAWLLSRYDDVRAALSDERFTQRSYAWSMEPMFGRTLVQMEGQEHTTHRALLAPAFLGRTVSTMRTGIEHTVGRLIDGLHGRPTADLAAEFCEQFPIHGIVHILGLPPEDAPLFRHWYQECVVYHNNYRQDPAMFERGLIARDELYAYLDPHLNRRRTHPGPGLLSHLCTATVDGKQLSDDMIKGFCGALLGEGAETIDKGLRSMLANLLDYPAEMAVLRADPSLIYPSWTESLRRDPPLQVIFRETALPAEVPSGPLPAHATVACIVGAANRDPSQFPDPDRFDPRRPGNNRGLAFSAGKHTCFGAQLARLEAEIAIQSLLTAFPRLRWVPQTTRTDAGFPMRTPATLQVSLN